MFFSYDSYLFRLDFSKSFFRFIYLNDINKSKIIEIIWGFFILILKNLLKLHIIGLASLIASLIYYSKCFMKFKEKSDYF